MPDLLFYSTNSLMAYLINEYYYRGNHYLYCTPYFERHPDPNFPPLAPTSNPKILYERLMEESKTSDKNAHHINANKHGLKIGVEERLKAGIITTAVKNEIVEFIDGAPNVQFKPKLYLIPAEGVRSLLKPVPYHVRATSVIDEYCLDITKEKFDVIDY